MAQWKRGQSGNPKGRPKGSKNKSTAEIKDLLAELVSFDELVSKLDSMARRGNVRAAEILLSYRFGKPLGRDELTIASQEMTSQQIQRAAERALAELC